MSYIETLRRIPDDQFLWMFAEQFDEGTGSCCVCGNAIRAAVTKASGAYFSADALNDDALAASGIYSDEIIDRCIELFGGTDDDWRNIYWGRDSYAGLEVAVVDRLNEIVS